MFFLDGSHQIDRRIKTFTFRRALVYARKSDRASMVEYKESLVVLCFGFGFGMNAFSSSLKKFLCEI